MCVRVRGATWVPLEVMESDGGTGGWFNSVWNAYHKLNRQASPYSFSFKNGAVLVFFSGLPLNCAFNGNPKNTSNVILHRVYCGCKFVSSILNDFLLN